jgi:DNA topoisomerase-1
MSKHLVIVESPTKAKTIKKFLGKDYSVHASMGHVRDLPSSTLAVDTEKNFEAVYEVPKDKATVVKNLQKELNDAEGLWIATDEDREGEAIGWHLVELLKCKKGQEVKRIAFHEITESAITEAMANPRELNQNLVEAQQARRILDRLVGYTLSPFLWKKVYRGLSAGRVQSVAVRIIVDREREIQAFNAEEYWTVEAHLQTDNNENFIANLKDHEGKKCVPTSEKEAQQVLDGTKGEDFSVAAVEEKELKKNPPAPFTTSTLQQEAGRKLGFSVKQTMVVAQQLYEGMSLGKGQGQSGLITYMRTDSVNLSTKALADAASAIEKLYGREYVLSEPRKYKTKAKAAQEAHEAIRPTEMERTPESLRDVLDQQQHKLYTLIWNRTMATQMASAELKRIGADISAGTYTFRATGQTILFDGFLRVYREDRDEPEEDERSGDKEKEADDGEKFLPPLSEGQKLGCDEVVPEQHFTKPPPRYTEASLVKKMEEEGIGRPSTYAPTISTVQQRGYITKEGKQLLPQDIAFTVTDLLVEHFSDIVNLTFTAKMEQSLDDIAEGSQERAGFLKSFFVPFKELVETKGEEVKKEDILKEREIGIDPKTSLAVVVRTGRFGPYVQLGRLEDLTEEEKKKKVKPKSASLPDGVHKDEITLEQALVLFTLPRELGTMDGEKIVVNTGRFGPYLRLGKYTVSLPAEADPYSLTEDEAKTLVKEGREKAKKAAEPLKSLGKDPNTEGEILLKDGRYGPYVTDGKTNASLGKKFTPDEITFEDAVDLLEKKRKRPPRKFTKKK